MEKYEYKFIKDTDILNRRSWFNEAGREGWELCGIERLCIIFFQHDTRYIFKRKLRE